MCEEALKKKLYLVTYFKQITLALFGFVRLVLSTRKAERELKTTVKSRDRQHVIAKI